MKSDQFHFSFSCLFPFVSLTKVQGFPPPSNQGFPGPCPDDRAHTSVQDSLNESSGDPNPTLVFSKNKTKKTLGAFAPRGPFRALDAHPSSKDVLQPDRAGNVRNSGTRDGKAGPDRIKTSNNQTGLHRTGRDHPELR